MQRDAAAIAILERCEDILTRWQSTLDRQAALTQEQNLIGQEYSDAVAAARLFGFDLLAEHGAYQIEKQQQRIALSGMQFPVFEGSPETPLALAATAPAPPVIPATKQKPIREHILDEAQEAYPYAVRAKGLREKLELLGFNVHEKTVGMTLYRLSKERKVRREGKSDWYFVPEALREASDLGAEATRVAQMLLE